jgi:uncharacterized membrane protein
MSKTVAVCTVEIIMEQVHLVIVTPVSMVALVDSQTPVDATTVHVKKVSGEENELVSGSFYGKSTHKGAIFNLTASDFNEIWQTYRPCGCN